MNHVHRILLLIVCSALLVAWVIKHSEPTTSLGLRYIQQAQHVEEGGWRKVFYSGVEHPLHPVLIAAAHRLFDGDSPASWQRAALLVSFTSAILLVIPIYLVALQLFGEAGSFLGVALFMTNAVIGSIVVNVLSETSFLLWWSFGLWAAVRFLKDGRFVWLTLTVGFGALAYLTRPEGILLPLALAFVMVIVPFQRATRINWPRWWGAIMLVIAGALLLSGPYVAIKGGLGTKPGVARVLGLAPPSAPLALERDAPLRPGQTAIETYAVACARTVESAMGSVTLPLLPFSLIGLAVAARRDGGSRGVLLIGIVFCATAVALVRLHATGGYVMPRHALVLGLVLTLAAGTGLQWLTNRVSIPGQWLGLAHDRFKPGPAVTGALISILAIVPNIRSLGPAHPGPFSVYYTAGDWLAANARSEEKILDLTDWSLFFSHRVGYGFADVHTAPADPEMRWVVVQKPDAEREWHYSRIVRDLVRGREAVARVPAMAAPGETQVCIYDCQAPVPLAASGGFNLRDQEAKHRD
jgi:hypothetical protein